MPAAATSLTAFAAPGTSKLCSSVREKTQRKLRRFRAHYCLRHRNTPEVFPVTGVFQWRESLACLFHPHAGLTNEATPETIEELHPCSMWACGAAGSALPWHGRGHRFDPDQVHQLSSPPWRQLAPILLFSDRIDGGFWRAGLRLPCSSLQQPSWASGARREWSPPYPQRPPA